MILFFEPYFEVKPWAGDELNKIYDCPLNTGEAWIVSGYNKKSSIVKNGKYKGQTLRHLWSKHPELFGDYPDKEFPLLIKLISSKDNLSIQVHPNDDYAIQKHNSLGKFECWYILPETKAKEVTLGVNVKNAAELKDIIQKGIIEQFLIKKEIKPDDLVEIMPGRCHAIHGETFLLEIQEASNITYRLYDFDREPKRELHIEDSLNVIDYNNNKNFIHNFKEEDTFKNNHFNLYKLIVQGEIKYENKGFEIFYVVAGEGSIDGQYIKKGDAFLFTNTQDSFTMDGDLEIIAVIPKPKDKGRLKMRKVAFITGIVGQDGSYLAELLLSKDYEVHGLIQSKMQMSNPTVSQFVNNHEIFNKSFYLHIGDLTDSSNINRLLESIKPDEVYHLASQSHVDISFDMPEYTTQVNSVGTLRLLDAIKSSEIRTKIFNLSTPYLFSGDIYPQKENTVFDPKSPYAISKQFSHQMVKSYRENFNIFAVNGICYNHDSPRRADSFVSKKITNFVKQLKQGKNEVLKLGNLNSKREWGHAQDYAEAMWLALNQETSDDYIISTGQAYTIREFVTKAFAKIGIPLEWKGSGLNEQGIDGRTKDVLVEVDPKLIRPNDAKVLVGDSAKFRKRTGWTPKYDLDSLLDSMLEDETC
ncbi:MAG: GDP-mannose 4,6-dehydratase [Anaeroplasmataceae bacterium]|nr:GDP-mannose 4,6-dehydratase [Anaeroplasmataceae bacterium]